MKNIIYLILIIGITSCQWINRNNKTENSNQCDTNYTVPTLELNGKIKELVEIKNWLAIGPFTYDTVAQKPQNTFWNKDLAPFGVDEKQFSKDDLRKIEHAYCPFLINSPTSTIKLVNYCKKDIAEISNFYLCTNIYSPVEQELTLITDGSNSYKIWINNVEKFTVTGKYNTVKVSDRYINIKLKQGDNFIFVKINRGSNKKSFDLISALAPLPISKEIYSSCYLKDFIANPVLSDSIKIYSGPYEKGAIELPDANGVKQKYDFKEGPFHSFPIPPGLKAGFYECALKLDGFTLNETFYKGDLVSFIEKLNDTIATINSGTESITEIDACQQRLQYLIDKYESTSSASQMHIQDRGLVYWAKNLQKLVNYYFKNKSINNYRGTFIKSYKQNENDTLQYFLYHVNSVKSNKGKLPLLIIVPYALNGTSLIEDWYLSNLDQIEIDNYLADKYNFAIAWAYQYGKNYTPIKGMKDIQGIISTLRNEPYLDTSKIYLMGDCVGGGKALLLAQRTPERFAGVTAYGPITTNGYGNDIPVNYIPNLYNLPVFISHGESDNVSPFENTVSFIEEAERTGFKIILDATKSSHMGFNKDYHLSGFKFLKSLEKVKKNPHPYKIKYCTYDLELISSYWINILSISNNGEKAEFSAEYDPKEKKISITTYNISQLEIDCKKLGLQIGKTISITLNNEIVYNGAVKNRIPLTIK